MQKQQSQVSSSTQYRYSHHGRLDLLTEYVTFKNQYESTLSNSRIQELKKIYPHGILGRTEESQVVVLDRIGIIKNNDISKYVDDEMLMGYTMQRLLYLSQNVLHQKDRVIWIIDLSGKIMQLASKKAFTLLQKIVANAQKYFPGLLHKLYFINTPMLFDTIWSKINLTIDENTQSKIVHLADELDELIAEVGLSLLPQYLGGSQPDQILQKTDQTQRQHSEDDKKSDRSQGSHGQQQIDFSSLKMALSGLKLGGSHPNKSVAQTPLNTEADDAK